jgi:hypothetical protein
MAEPVVGPVDEPVVEPVVDAPVAPFDGYDTMPAVHVVERLRRMSPQQLREVRNYEAARRARRTVLGKIDQLLA